MRVSVREQRLPKVSNLIVRPQRVLALILGVFYYSARKTGAVKIYGKCPKCGEEFELPQRVKAPFRVECPKCKEKVSRIRAIIEYVKAHKGGGE